jgi:prophage DNA circulation protein
MSNFDLGTVPGFTAATSSLSSLTSGASQLALLFGRKPEEWDIEEASYNDVIFNVMTSKVAWQGAVSSVNDSGGRRLAKYQFAYKDGQTTDDLGRAANTFDIEIFFYGDNYLEGMVSLFDELNKPQAGTLIHPVRGELLCKMESYSMTHAAESRKAVKINLRLTEHNFDIDSYETIGTADNYKSVLGELAKAFQYLNNLVTKIKGLVQFINNIRNVALALIEDLQNIMALTCSNINTVFNKGQSTDIPTIKPVTFGGLLQVESGLTASGAVAKISSNISTITNSRYSLATRINDPFVKVPIDSLTAPAAIALAATTVQKQVEDTRAAAQTAIDYLSAMQTNSLTVDTTTQTVDGAIEFWDDIMAIKRMLVNLQKAFEQGLAQNKARIIEYTVPYDMSIRMVAFNNGISVEDTNDIDIMNPELLSVNLIPKGTVLKLAVA